MAATKKVLILTADAGFGHRAAANAVADALRERYGADCAAGLPLLLVQAIPGQEEGNATYVTEGGAGVLAKDPIEALVTVGHWLEDGGAGLAERATQARALGRPQAAHRVAELAWEAAQQGAQRREHRLGRQIPLLQQILRSRDLSRSPEKSGARSDA